jgi:hypothetical protein
MRVVQQLGKRREGARCYNLNVSIKPSHKFGDSLVVHKSWRAGNGCHLTQKSGLFLVALHKMHSRPGVLGESAGNRHSRKSTARPKVDPLPCVPCQRKKLKRVGDMPRPQMRYRRRSDEMSGLLPPQEQIDEALEAGECFT